MFSCMKIDDILKYDKHRYGATQMPLYQKYYRRSQHSSVIISNLYKLLMKISRCLNHIEISSQVSIGPGLYMGHAYCITINPDAVIGRNCNIHRGVVIGQTNRGGA